jgi:tetratricopeptide (TPR) repeat protein
MTRATPQHSTEHLPVLSTSQLQCAQFPQMAVISGINTDLDAIPCWNPVKAPKPFEAIYAGWIYKQGHQIKNWKNRYFVIKGCVIIYYKTDLAYTQDFSELPKGIHIITSLKEDSKKNPLGWVMDTLDQKPFNLKVSTEAEKAHLIAVMKYAIRCYEKQFKIHNWEPKVTLPVALVTVGYLDLAIELFENYLRSNSSAPSTIAEVYYHLGTSYLMRETPESLESAYSALQSCVELESNHHHARANLGFAAFLKGEVEEAKQILESVLSDSPTCLEAANNLAIVLVHRGEPGDLETAEAKVVTSSFLLL